MKLSLFCLFTLLVLLPSGAFCADADFNGRWDITVTEPKPALRARWLEVEGAGTANVRGKFIGFPGGDLDTIPAISIANGKLSFSVTRTQSYLPPAQRKKRLYSFRVKGNKLTGKLRFEDDNKVMEIYQGVRAPELTETDDGSWLPAKKIELFNGKNLKGWHASNPARKLSWTISDGILVNAPPTSDLKSDEKFWNFDLHIEYRVDEDSNSGIGLRGRYEVQILGDYGKPVNIHGNGALYSRIVPSENASLPPGKWQTFDIRLIGREVTIVLNDRKIIDKKIIEGLTAIANNADEGEPGPLLVQGDHGKVEFRKITVTPLMQKKK